MANRIRPADVARMTSLSVRKVQEMSAAGCIPSAAKLGAVWTYDPDQIRAWIKQAEQKAVRQAQCTPTALTRRGRTFQASSTGSLYERLIDPKRLPAQGKV